MNSLLIDGNLNNLKNIKNINDYLCHLWQYNFGMFFPNQNELTFSSINHQNNLNYFFENVTTISDFTK